MFINLPHNDCNEILILSGNIQNTLHSLHEISATAPSHNSKALYPIYIHPTIFKLLTLIYP